MIARLSWSWDHKSIPRFDGLTQSTIAVDLAQLFGFWPSPN